MARAILCTADVYPIAGGTHDRLVPLSLRFANGCDPLGQQTWPGHQRRLLPQTLKEAGYRTTIIGKWRLGHGEHKYWPRQRGLDYQSGPVLGEIDYFTHSAHRTTDWYPDNKLVKEEGYVTTLLGNEAVKLIDAHDPKTPLFLYLTFTAPHTPYQAPQDYLDKYKQIVDPSRRAYAAMVTAMDDQIGRMIDELDTRGMRNNTLFVFQSDNGGNGRPSSRAR